MDSENKNCRRCIRLGAKCEFVTTKRTRKARTTGGGRAAKSESAHLSPNRERNLYGGGGSGGYPRGAGGMPMYRPPALAPYPPPPPGLYSSSSGGRGAASTGMPPASTFMHSSVRISTFVASYSCPVLPRSWIFPERSKHVPLSFSLS